MSLKNRLRFPAIKSTSDLFSGAFSRRLFLLSKQVSS